MILVDTSVWIKHLRYGDSELTNLLDKGQVLIHRFVIGELALGNLKNRNIILSSVQNLPLELAATDEEVFHFIETHSLAGCGIGFIDAHLLAAVRLYPGSSLWTRDKNLQAVGTRLGLCANIAH